MKLIKLLGTRPSKNGNCVNSWGEFLCEFDNKIVERTLSSGKEAKSCGCVQYELASKNKTGQKRTLEQRQNISKALKGKKKSEEHIKNVSKALKGKKWSEETRKKQSKNRKRRVPWNKGLTKETSESVKKISISNLGKKGILSPSWQGGKSFEEYGVEFNKEKKQQVLERDNYTCQCPDCKGKSSKLDVHHIDYDKKNNNLENLITLCRNCHSKTSGKKKRQYYTEYYQNIMMGKLIECFL